MPRSFTKDEYVAEDLLQAGLDHLSAAKILLNSDPFVFDSAGYLAHMGLELMLKSWLLHLNGKFQGIHPLADLIQNLRDSGNEVQLSDREEQTLAYLSNFVELRYPTKNSPIEIGSEDMQQIYELADAIWEKLPQELIDAYKNIPKDRKGGRRLMERPSDIPRNLELETGIKTESDVEEEIREEEEQDEKEGITGRQIFWAVVAFLILVYFLSS